VTNIVLGKFYPPHAGHKYLIDFSKHYASFSSARTYVLVAGLKSEKIPVKDRFKALCEHYDYDPHTKKGTKGVSIHWADDDMPQTPEESPDNFFKLWRYYIESKLNYMIDRRDILFASESYGAPLAKEIGCQFVPVDINRTNVNISGTEIRNNFGENFSSIIKPMRRRLVKTVSFLGAESVGKTETSKAVAQKLAAQWVPEFAREFLYAIGDNNLTDWSMTAIALGQSASTKAVREDPKTQYVIEDTSAIQTFVWYRIFFPDKQVPQQIINAIHEEQRDLYIVLDDNVPFVQDRLRYGDGVRQATTENVVEALIKWKRPYVVMKSKDFNVRTNACVDLIKKLGLDFEF
jgi:HTH-type transcriptional regulator, transcriptional repressor of NAD biosynthesis genes